MTGADLPLWVTVPGTLLLVTGGLVTLIGSLGLLRLPDFYARLHGPSMGNTIGTFTVLVASMQDEAVNQQAAAPEQDVNVVVASRDLPAMTMLSDGDVVTRTVKRSLAPAAVTLPTPRPPVPPPRHADRGWGAA